MSQLDTDQRWMLAAITTKRTPARIGRLGGAAVPAAVGLGIYRHAYRARLQECLLDDFPAVAALLGAELFAELADTVITECPPVDSTLNRYGKRLVTWLGSHLTATSHGRIAYDLARLEWALVEALHAPLTAHLDPAALAAVPSRRWAKVRLVPVPSLRRISSRWPIDSIFRQHLRQEVMVVPAPDPGTVLVVRDTQGLHRRTITPGAARLLLRLVRGEPLGQAIAGCGLDATAIQLACANLFTAGCFAGLETT